MIASVYVHEIDKFYDSSLMAMHTLKHYTNVLNLHPRLESRGAPTRQ